MPDGFRISQRGHAIPRPRGGGHGSRSRAKGRTPRPPRAARAAAVHGNPGPGRGNPVDGAHGVFQDGIRKGATVAGARGGVAPGGRRALSRCEGVTKGGSIGATVPGRSEEERPAPVGSDETPRKGHGPLHVVAPERPAAIRARRWLNGPSGVRWSAPSAITERRRDAIISAAPDSVGVPASAAPRPSSALAPFSGPATREDAPPPAVARPI